MKRNKKIKQLTDLAEFIVKDSADLFLLFADLCGSTAYKDFCSKSQMPDFTWICRQLFFLKRSNDLITKFNGVTAKTNGDSLFAYFDATASPEEVLKCAVEIIQVFDGLILFQGQSKIEVKISLDFGPTYNGAVIDSKIYDPIGTAVDRCARLNSQALKNEILFSKDFLDNIGLGVKNIKSKYNYRPTKTNLKGLGEIEYYKILVK